MIFLNLIYFIGWFGGAVFGWILDWFWVCCDEFVCCCDVFGVLFNWFWFCCDEFWCNSDDVTWFVE